MYRVFIWTFILFLGPSPLSLVFASGCQIFQTVYESTDDLSIDQLLEDLRPKIVRYAKSTKRKDWRDLVDLGLSKAGAAYNRFPGGDLIGYCFRSARNAILDVIRKKTIPELAQTRDGSETTLIDESPSPVERVIAIEENEILFLAISRLSPIHQDVIELRVLQELSVEEAADQLGIPKGTVNRG